MLAFGVERDAMGVATRADLEAGCALPAGLIPRSLVFAVDDAREFATLFAGAGEDTDGLRDDCGRCGAGVCGATTGRLRLRWVFNCASALGCAAGITDGTDDAAIGRLSTIVDIDAIDGAPARGAANPADEDTAAAIPASSAVGLGSRSRISRAERGRFSISFSSALVITLSVCKETCGASERSGGKLNGGSS